MYEYVITCQKCEAVRSTHGLDQLANLTDEEVLALAGHVPTCSVKRARTGSVQRMQREEEPEVMLYSVEEVA